MERICYNAITVKREQNESEVKASGRVPLLSNCGYSVIEQKADKNKRISYTEFEQQLQKTDRHHVELVGRKGLTGC